MKLIIFSCAIALFTGITAPTPTTSAKDSTILFKGTTPCNNIIRPLFKISLEVSCQLVECKCAMVEWTLALYRDPATLRPTHYKLSSINRFIVKGTNMYSQPGTKSDIEGNWTVIQNSKTNPGEIIYQLNPDKPELSINLLKLNDNLLHILDRDGKLMIGNEFWSYTLNRSAN